MASIDFIAASDCWSVFMVLMKMGKLIWIKPVSSFTFGSREVIELSGLVDSVCAEATKQACHDGPVVALAASDLMEAARSRITSTTMKDPEVLSKVMPHRE